MWGLRGREGTELAIYTKWIGYPRFQTIHVISSSMGCDEKLNHKQQSELIGTSHMCES